MRLNSMLCSERLMNWRMISAINAVIILMMMVVPAQCISRWVNQPNWSEGNSFGQHYDWSDLSQNCFLAKPVTAPHCIGITTDWHGSCPGRSEAFLSGIIYASLKWNGEGAMPRRVHLHMKTTCSWVADSSGSTPPDGAVGRIKCSAGGQVFPLGGLGVEGENLASEHTFWADTRPDGTVKVAVSFNATASVAGNATPSGQISVSAQISHLDEEPTLENPPSDASASWKASSMSYWPRSPCFSPLNGAAKSGGDPVNLASGRHEYLPDADISAYNPNGPRAAFIRNFEGYEADLGLGSPGLSSGWMHNYDVAVIAEESTPTTWCKLNLAYPTGARESLTPLVNSEQEPTGEFGKEAGTPYVVTGEHSDVVGRWNWIKVTWKDGTGWTFTPALGPGYKLTRITDAVGAYINVVRDASAGYRVSSVTDDGSPANMLLTFSYDAAGKLSSVCDAYDRKVVYSFAGDDLASVSQIAGIADGNPRAREMYDYYQLGPLLSSHLHNIRRPCPTGTGTSFLRAIYELETCKVERMVDSNNNSTAFEYYANGTRIRVKNAQGQLVKEWTENYDPSNSSVNIGTTDVTGTCTYREFGDSRNPTLPTTVMDKSGKSAVLEYDQFGNTTKVTSPRGVETVFTYDYPGDDLPSEFPFGRLVSVQVGTLTPTTFTYYEPSGLVHTITSPKPGTTDGSTVTTTFTYDPLGNIRTKTIPAASDSGTTTIRYNYTTDGDYSQPARVGQPLTVTDNMGHVTHFRYDARGNVISVKDALGHETSFTYNIADQVISTTYPAALP